MTIPEILKSVLKARSEGIPESQIDEYLGKKGYTRKRFEEAVRYSIDKQSKKAGYQKALGDKFSPQFAGAVARELTNGILYEFGDEVEAFLRTLVTDQFHHKRQPHRTRHRHRPPSVQKSKWYPASDRLAPRRLRTGLQGLASGR